MPDNPAPNAPLDPASVQSQVESVLAKLQATNERIRMELQTVHSLNGCDARTIAWAQYVQDAQHAVAEVGQSIERLEQQNNCLEQQAQELEQQARELEQGNLRLEQQAQELEQGNQRLEQQAQELEQLQQAQGLGLEIPGAGPGMRVLLQHTQGNLQVAEGLLQIIRRNLQDRQWLFREMQQLFREMRTLQEHLLADLRAAAESIERLRTARNTVQRVDSAAATGSRDILAKRALLPRAQRPDPWAPRTRGRPLRIRICLLVCKPSGHSR